jgi:hypothetical protein
MNLKEYLFLQRAALLSEPEILAGYCVDDTTSDGGPHIWVSLSICRLECCSGGLQMTAACINKLEERVLHQPTSLLQRDIKHSKRMTSVFIFTSTLELLALLTSNKKRPVHGT